MYCFFDKIVIELMRQNEGDILWYLLYECMQGCRVILYIINYVQIIAITCKVCYSSTAVSSSLIVNRSYLCFFKVNVEEYKSDGGQCSVSTTVFMLRSVIHTDSGTWRSGCLPLLLVHAWYDRTTIYTCVFSIFPRRYCISRRGWGYPGTRK